MRGAVSTPQYVFMVWRLVKHRDFTFTFTFVNFVYMTDRPMRREQNITKLDLKIEADRKTFIVRMEKGTESQFMVTPWVVKTHTITIMTMIITYKHFQPNGGDHVNSNLIH
jgi:exosome complex RNA-binding protein Rrp42 (RNase PH superfamily)